MNHRYANLKQDSLILHGSDVEAVMSYFDEKTGEEIEKWGIDYSAIIDFLIAFVTAPI